MKCSNWLLRILSPYKPYWIKSIQLGNYFNRPKMLRIKPFCFFIHIILRWGTRNILCNVVRNWIKAAKIVSEKENTFSGVLNSGNEMVMRRTKQSKYKKIYSEN